MIVVENHTEITEQIYVIVAEIHIEIKEQIYVIVVKNQHLVTASKPINKQIYV